MNVEYTEFPKKPLMRALLIKMVDAVQNMADILPGLKDRKTIYGWIISQQWKDMQEAMAAAGLLEKYKTCVVGKNEAGVQACFAQYQDKMVAWAVSEYIREAGTNPVAYRAAGEGGAPVDESKGMSAGTMMGIGAGVILLGGIGYYAYTESQKKTSKRNPVKKGRKSITERWKDGEIKVAVWEERDRLSIAINDEQSDKTLAEWWDDDARQMFEDGFFKGGKDLHRSVIEYAEYVGIDPYGRTTKKSRKKYRFNPAVRTGHFGYGSKPTKGLRSTLDSPAVEKAVTKLAKKNFKGAETLDIVYEHGQWWINVFPDPEDPSGDNEASYSVVDTSSGLDVERI